MSSCMGSILTGQYSSASGFRIFVSEFDALNPTRRRAVLPVCKAREWTRRHTTEVVAVARLHPSFIQINRLRAGRLLVGRRPGGHWPVPAETGTAGQASCGRRGRPDWPCGTRYQECPGSSVSGRETTRRPSARTSATRTRATREPRSGLPPASSSNRSAEVMPRRVTENARLVAVVAELLELAPGDAGAGRLPERAPRYVPKKIFLIAQSRRPSSWRPQGQAGCPGALILR